MKRNFLFLLMAALLSFGSIGCVTSSNLKPGEIARISSIAILTDSSVSLGMNLMDVAENRKYAASVTARAMTLLSEKGFAPNASESIMTVGSVYPDKYHMNIIDAGGIKIGGEPDGVLPPYFLDNPSFNDRGRILTDLFQNLLHSEPADEIAVETEDERSYFDPNIMNLGLISDAALLIKIGGITRRTEERLAGFAFNVAFGLLTGNIGPAGTTDHSHMGLYLLNVRTGEMLWTGNFSGGGQPDEDVFREKLEKILKKLPIRSNEPRISANKR